MNIAIKVIILLLFAIAAVWIDVNAYTALAAEGHDVLGLLVVVAVSFVTAKASADVIFA